jgi:hypothetical protein
MTDDGQVIGLVVSGIAADGAENLNFALPINYVRGQLSLASSRSLRTLEEVQDETVLAGGGSSGGGSSTGDPSSGAPSPGPAAYGDLALDEGFRPDPHEFSLTAGGTIAVGIESCNGHVAEQPDVNFYYESSGGATLFVYVIADEDTTLLINRPDRAWACDDDDLGEENPLVVIPTAAGGLYNIWVGTYYTDNTPALLYISEIDPR